jgi:hypothetical protein
MAREDEVQALAVEVSERAQELSTLLVGGVDLPAGVPARLAEALSQTLQALAQAECDLAECGPLG